MNSTTVGDILHTYIMANIELQNNLKKKKIIGMSDHEYNISLLIHN